MKLYIARDANDLLALYHAKPTKLEHQHGWYASGTFPSFCPLAFSCEIFPEVKWEDKEPKLVELKLIDENEKDN